MANAVDAAVRALEGGGIIVYPTDTLVGLGVRATDRRAVARLRELKGRPGGMPISIAVSSLEELERWTRLTSERRRIIRRTLPGPYTVLVPASVMARRKLAPDVLGPDASLGLRVPDHPVAREVARRAGPITATSANRHGEPPSPTVAAARKVFGRAIDAYVTLGPEPSGRPSMILDLRRDELRTVERP